MNYRKMHADMLELFIDMSDEDAGKMIKAIAKNSDEDLPFGLKIVFKVFEKQFSRDEKSYNSIVERNKKNGKKGGRPKTQKNPNNPVGFLGTQKSQEEEEEEKEEKKKEIYKETFELFRKKYPGTKKGLDTEFANFKKKHKDWKEAISILEPALEKQIQTREALTTAKKFVPEWKHLRTWINQRSWEEEPAKAQKKSLDEIYLEMNDDCKFAVRHGCDELDKMLNKYHL